MTDDIPDDHPRAASLRVRHKIIEGMHDKVVAEAGLIAHGRGEAYDYLIGEKTHEFAKKAIEAAAAYLFLADHPIISVNGNITALCPDDLVKLSNETNIPLEINIFYRKPGRLTAIENYLKPYGPKILLGLDEEFSTEIDEISSMRRIVDKRGIATADVVLVPLEDGDRTEGLVRNNKTVITVDLNPLSRTARKAHVTIVDNIIRVLPLLLQAYKQMDEKYAREVVKNYNNTKIIREALSTIASYWNTYELE